jgi:hypothetical protein
MLNGALLAFREVEEAGGISIQPVVVNPSGDLSRYRALSLELLGSGIRHVVGCYTSSSRKEVIPCFEKHDGLLWYPSHYEGFESSDNVIYTGAAPNQHVLPLVDYLASRIGSRAFCVGSNYIWAWENNRIFREALTACGGAGCFRISDGVAVDPEVIGGMEAQRRARADAYLVVWDRSQDEGTRRGTKTVDRRQSQLLAPRHPERTEYLCNTADGSDRVGAEE